ncbi:hypothetical protein AVEN_181561-1 [Araneus ventricosus]|uniref:Uncharacterized protein n=1 Tax=Araneus ventricosus TaxID=182803 RepID=A0A4Y2E430_ARAVE|nr:hypothetical protein AVEN_181561-1 [Araneus ventricosus]
MDRPMYTSGVYSPGRKGTFTLGVKAIPLCSANAWQALEQSQTSAFGCSRYLVPTEAAHSLLLTMLGSPIISDCCLGTGARVNYCPSICSRYPDTNKLSHSLVTMLGSPIISDCVALVYDDLLRPVSCWR